MSRDAETHPIVCVVGEPKVMDTYVNIIVLPYSSMYVSNWGDHERRCACALAIVTDQPCRLVSRCTSNALSRGFLVRKRSEYC